MSNKIIYSCDTSDEGSDMDVSDTDDGAQIFKQQQRRRSSATTKTINKQQRRPHEGMVVSLHNFMQHDSWPQQAIKPKVENVLPIPTTSTNSNPNSYARVASRKRSVDPDIDRIVNDVDDDDSSVDSFYTAPSSPQQEQDNDVDMDEIEPGQIQESTTTISEFEARIAKLEEEIRVNDEREKAIEKELKYWKDRQEAIRIRLLEHQVRTSIARNRKPANKKVKLNGSVAASTSNSSDQPIITTKGKDKRKERAEPRIPFVKQDTSKFINSATPLPTALPQPILNESSSSTFGQFAQHNKGINNMEGLSKKQQKTMNQLIQEEAQQEREHNAQLLRERDPDMQFGNRLLGAVIDKPMSKRFREDSDSENSGRESVEQETIGREMKRWEILGSELLSEEERRLIAPDAPPYTPVSRKGKGSRPTDAHREVVTYFQQNNLPLKQMRLTLKNLKDQSIKGNVLSVEQEELAAMLCKRLIKDIILYVTQKKPAKLETELNRNHLPRKYYGDFAKLDYTKPDLSHAELYKTIRHFDAMTSVKTQRNAMEYLLKSGKEPQGPIFRSCDPADRPDIHATPESDELPNVHVNKKSKKEKAAAKLERKQSNKFAKQENKRQLSIENAQLERDIDKLACEIHMNFRHQHQTETAAASQSTDNNASSSATQEELPNIITIDDDDFDDDFDDDVDMNLSSSVGPSTNAIPSTASNPSMNTRSATRRQSVIDMTDNVASDPFANSTDQASAGFVPISSSAVEERQESNQDTNTFSSSHQPQPVNNQHVSIRFTPYYSVIESLHLESAVHSDPTQDPDERSSEEPGEITSVSGPTFATLCDAESSGGVCNVKNCPYTHFKDFM